MFAYNKNKNFLFLKISVITCIVAFVTFLSFLNQTSVAKEQAQASIYIPDQVIMAVNQERQKAGLNVLQIDNKLMKSSNAKSLDMANKSYFSHISPIDGKKWSDFIKEENYDYIIAGENLANGFSDVPSMVEAWMKSPSHRDNILKDGVEETGVGISYGKLQNNPTIFVVQVFGKENVKK